MASIIEGYNYDIFISYRQKDNKGERWVSEFVDALKDELESTFKEEISVYFDINPHDGLLETYDVGASLVEKLKCLVFIPIISRTYCDPKSFAWEHEFKVFVEQASNDQFGLKVKLSNGNVANRVLPVRIHELDFNDIELCESIIGGVLRGVDFIYKSAGVNRPLRANEDHPQNNLNKTYFRDQINKVANAVKEIIYCLHPELKKLIGHHEQSANERRGSYTSALNPSSEQFDEVSPEHKSLPGKSALGKRGIIAFSLIVFLLASLGLWGWLRSTPDNKKKLVTYTTIPVESNSIEGGGDELCFSISPDGNKIAYSSVEGIHLRTLSGLSSEVLKGTERASQVIFSPDGQSVAYSKNGQIYKIGISGSPATLISPKNPSGGMFWGTDGYIYFSPAWGTDGIWRCPENGGEPEQITHIDDSLGGTHVWPQLLPDSKTLIFTDLGKSTGSLDSRILVQKVNGGDKMVLVDKAFFGRYLANGNLLFANNEGTVFTLPINLRNLKIKGKPTAVLSGVNTTSSSGAAYISVSETGNLIFLPRSDAPLSVLDVVDRSGILIKEDTIPSAIYKKIGHMWDFISLSPSGNIIALEGRSYGIHDIWLLNLKTMDTERITFDPTEDETPVWSPDGNAIAYTSVAERNSSRLLIKDIRSAENPHLVLEWPRHFHVTSWSPDNKWIAGIDYTITNGTDCYIVSADSGTVIPVATGKANEELGQFSPNGKWVAFQSDESGRSEIYVVSFPDLESKRQLSVDGGVRARWDRSGKAIYYINRNGLIYQPVEIDNEFIKGTPVSLFQAKASCFDVSPDGQRFYLRRKNNNRPSQPLYLITNWFEDLPTKKSE